MDFSVISSKINCDFEKIVCQDTAELYIIKNSGEEEFVSIKELLIDHGFSVSAERNIGETFFATLSYENHVVYLSLLPALNTIKIISKENETVIKEDDSSYVKTVTPLVTQVRTAYFSIDCGMSYVIRIGDGRFVLLDGGTGEYEESDRLWDVLVSQNELGEKPIIAAWFISHAHIDHFGGFVKFMDKYGHRVILQNLAYNWPATQFVYPASELNSLTEFNRVIESIKATTHILTPHSGQRYVFADAVFDVLFACEDLYPEFIPNFNDSSLVLMMELNGRKILWLGDMQKQGSDYMCKIYPKEAFECEILQVGHHGYNSASDALHRMADPETLLWPCPDFWFPVVRLWGENIYLITSPKIKNTIVGGQQQVVLDMTKPVPEFLPFKKYASGEVMYEEDFSGERVIDLNWSCITGGSTGYKAAKATLENNGCVLKTEFSENYTVCQFVQPGLLDLNPDFTLEFSGEIENGYESLGILWGYAKPTVFCEDKVFWLEPCADKTFKYTLKADFEKGKADLYENGALIKTMPYDEIGGLHFCLKNACLKLKHIRLIKGA